MGIFKLWMYTYQRTGEFKHMLPHHHSTRGRKSKEVGDSRYHPTCELGLIGSFHGHMVQNHTRWVRKLHSGKETKAGQSGLVRVLLFWKSHCVFCVPTWFFPYHVTVSCKGLLQYSRLGYLFFFSSQSRVSNSDLSNVLNITDRSGE